MRFILESITKEGSRCGLIKELGCHANLAIETPTCLMYTRAGAVPHLTWDLVENIKRRPQCVQLTCATLVDQQDSLSKFGKGIAQFASIPEDGVIYASVQDPAHPTRTGYNDKKGVSVFTCAGRTKIDLGLFITLQEAIQPNWFEALCDGDTPLGCSVKRTRKAVDRTLSLLDACIEAQQKSEKLRQSDILGVIEGGQILDERQRSAKETALRPVSGFVLDALADQQMDSSVKFELIEAVLKELPDSKTRLLPGVGKPTDVLQAVEAGIDIFDSSYPYQVTQRGWALVFPCELPPAHSQVIVDADSTGLSQLQQVKDASDVQGENDQIDPRFELDLSEKRFAEDFSPVLKGCDCYCCTHHTKAYINHLLNVNELLARVLLMDHNCHHYFEFFHSIRTSLKDGTFQKLKEAIVNNR
ncbi:queuine tRNA-ribosyltransferase accessory subunit 2 isoform X3 [Strongylocentrotus purpuratus]|uniref:Queuine tRNA-ribosyltransferase accessory subunit 2 n=1 Tax=Strongylocentrotus purpuratus TaxID=7668 RepID=A0A7M7PMT6_STRPU|nr:queuine tRNA-ribosyltransferase accessory subunit 2 isoform X3 [Strongylocentrotus purpuratus]XP_030853008.1 queuine tRNA-ribosyltransferase accessory subunit 2 isoform X3 [Strongylocentrotus purpuratus]